jgi:pyridoxine 5-phosphate synthase
MAKLSVNINKIATLRNARGENNPDLIAMALLIESLGAEGITVHPRPDERHITRRDLFELKKVVTTEFNVEGYPSNDFIALMHEIRPDQITLVPDPPHALTSNAGFKLSDDFHLLADSVKELKALGSRVSLFIDPLDFKNKSPQIIKDTGADRIELYTHRYAQFPNDANVISDYRELALSAQRLGLGINAGHDLSLSNLRNFLQEVPGVLEVSIGHALICDALLYGMPETIRRYLECSAE